MLYNVEGSDFYILADKLSKQFEKKFKAVPDAATAGAPVRQPTFKEKMDFGEKVYRVTPQQLGRVVQVLDEKCAWLSKAMEGMIKIVKSLESRPDSVRDRKISPPRRARPTFGSPCRCRSASPSTGAASASTTTRK